MKTESRKLATVQVISKLTPIEGADRIQLATVMGWNCIVKIGEFQEGDQCCYFEIDSELPKAEWSAFMERRKYRVKTLRLRGTLSQGLALPMSILPEGEYEVGQDITEVLGVKKYVPRQNNKGRWGLGKLKRISTFPSFIPKTDELRIQSNMRFIEDLKNAGGFYIAQKQDGSSGTYARFKGEFYTCSRNMRLDSKERENSFWAVAEKYKLEEVIDEGFAIQGEVVGPKIQENKLNVSEDDLFVFNVFNIKEGRFLDYIDMLAWCEKRGLQTVPVDGVYVEADLEDFDWSLNHWLELAKGCYWGEQPREGIVVRPLKETRNYRGYRLSFKVINNDYL